jgi:hypothetical protein
LKALLCEVRKVTARRFYVQRRTKGRKDSKAGQQRNDAALNWLPYCSLSNHYKNSGALKQ